MTGDDDAHSSDITAVVVTWRGADHVGACLDSLLSQTVRASILVIDNASDDGTAAVLLRYQERWPQVRVLRTARNLGFAGGMAVAMDAVSTDLVALLNDDATADPEWLAALVGALRRRPDAAAATSQLLLADGAQVNNAGVALDSAGYGYDVGLGEDPAAHQRAGEVFGFSGGAALLRAAAVRQVGGFPAQFFMYYEDTDLSWRLQLAGWRVIYEPAARVLHRHGASAGPASAMFAFHNERNRLWMLVRCAPAGVAARQLARFPLTTASLAVQTVRRRRPPGAQFSVRLRIAVMAGTARRLLPLLRQRRAVGARAALRARVWASARRLSS